MFSPTAKTNPTHIRSWEGQSISNSANENERNRFENQINEHCSASAHSHQGKIEDTIGLFKGKSSFCLRNETETVRTGILNYGYGWGLFLLSALK
jgi:hypothetical protein